MEQTDDQNLRELLGQMTDVPFSPELKHRIRAKANEMHVNQTGRLKPPRRTSVVRIASVAGGLLAAAAIVFAVFGHPNSTTWLHPTTVSETAAAPTYYGLKYPAVQISGMHIGNEQGFPKNSEVIAQLTNHSSVPISKKNIFGVLSFSANNSNSENFITFVNGPDTPIPPGQTGTWTFHPVGVPGTSGGQLTEKTTLSFYSSELVNQPQADVVWRVAPVHVSNVQVRSLGLTNSGKSRGELAEVSATLINPTNKPILLSSLLALIWFNNKDESFVSPDSTRFMNNIDPTKNVKSSVNTSAEIAPGQSLTVYFHVVGGANSTFFEQTPHVVFIDKPSP